VTLVDADVVALLLAWNELTDFDSDEVLNVLVTSAVYDGEADGVPFDCEKDPDVEASLEMVVL
jgi:hypothetical protein